MASSRASLCSGFKDRAWPRGGLVNSSLCSCRSFCPTSTQVSLHQHQGLLRLQSLIPRIHMTGSFLWFALLTQISPLRKVFPGPSTLHLNCHHCPIFFTMLIHSVTLYDLLTCLVFLCPVWKVSELHEDTVRGCLVHCCIPTTKNTDHVIGQAEASARA